MKIILVLIAAILLSLNASADDNKEHKTTQKNTTEVAYSMQTVDVKGSIIDKNSHESLAGAAFFIDGTKYYSDLEGNFAISNLKPGKHTLRVELISYKPAEMEIYVKKGQKINISLVQE